MKKKFKFHCLDDDSESITESSDTEEPSDDDIPEKNPPSQILDTNINDNFSPEDENSLTPPPPLPSASSSEPQSPNNNRNEKMNDSVEVISLIQSFDANDSMIPSSIPDDLFSHEIDEEPPPPEVEEAENIDEYTNNDDTSEHNAEKEKQSKKRKKYSIPKSLKRKNKPMTRENELILNTNRIYDYFNHKISKLAILKAIHAKCGDFRLAILALAHDPTQFDDISLFESPKSDPEKIKNYLIL